MALLQLQTPAPRKPPWLRVRLPSGDNYFALKRLVRQWRLHTVCEEALCPNIGECWERRSATFMLLGDTCTRSCGFCAVKTGRPLPLDEAEPERVAQAVALLNLRYAVVTSVNRDDLPDGGSHIFAATIRAIRRRLPACKVEVLIPDFKGNWEALAEVVAARPDVLNHNIESVPRLYRQVRPQARYARSLELLRRAKQLDPTLRTKSGMMVGLGETFEEVLATLRDLRAAEVDLLTIGQYLRPSPHHLPVVRYYTPEEFAALRQAGEALGFVHVEAGPLVRSSYHADVQEAAARR
ncbi:MAG: lipoyl synthase [Candidatus Tectimicrobiota bacterium]|nr:MAG: lipoyl synthase [Candidatus Tectomicrobia bacterium]